MDQFFRNGSRSESFRSLVFLQFGTGLGHTQGPLAKARASLAFICVEFGDTIAIKSLDVGGVKCNYSTFWRNDSNFSQTMGMMRFENGITDLAIDYKSTDWFMEKIENGTIMSGNVETDINSIIKTYYVFKGRRLNFQICWTSGPGPVNLVHST